jgi:hypothetical protein
MWCTSLIVRRRALLLQMCFRTITHNGINDSPTALLLSFLDKSNRCGAVAHATAVPCC